MSEANKEEVRKVEKITNPGTLLNLKDKSTSVFPIFFDGLKVQVYRSLSSHFKVIHSIFLSSITPGNYRFGATYVGTKPVRKFDNVPVLFGDIGSNGNLNATMYHLFGSRIQVKFDAQMENRSFVTSQLTTHYFGDRFTASAILANSDLLSKSGCIVLQYLQNVTPKVAIGTEFVCLRNLASYKSPNLVLDGSMTSQVSIMGRYTTPLTVWCTVLSLNSIFLSCYKQASSQIEFGIEMDTNLRTNESVGSAAFKVKLVNRGIVCRGCIDTNTNVGSVFEKRFCGSPFVLAVSANLNYRTSNFRLGVGVVVDG